jgi:hypothetical protein
MPQECVSAKGRRGGRCRSRPANALRIASVKSSARLCCTAALCPVAVVLAGCGTSTIKAGGAEKSVVDVVSRQTGFHPTDVKCPSGVAAKAGRTFECHFTGPGGQRYTAFMKILSVKGSRVDFFVSTRPSR